MLIVCDKEKQEAESVRPSIRH